MTLPTAANKKALFNVTFINVITKAAVSKVFISIVVLSMTNLKNAAKIGNLKLSMTKWQHVTLSKTYHLLSFRLQKITCVNVMSDIFKSIL
jgi:hypothetical protein